MVATEKIILYIYIYSTIHFMESFLWIQRAQQVKYCKLVKLARFLWLSKFQEVSSIPRTLFHFPSLYYNQSWMIFWYSCDIPQSQLHQEMILNLRKNAFAADAENKRPMMHTDDFKKLGFTVIISKLLKLSLINCWSSVRNNPPLPHLKKE